MTTTLVLCCCLSGPAAPAAPAPLPRTEADILRELADYRAHAAAEQTVVGILRESPGAGRTTPTLFRIEIPLTTYVSRLQLLEVGERGRRLRPYVGKRVRITGKLVRPPNPTGGPPPPESLWVGRAELLESNHPGPRNVLARCGWQPPAGVLHGVQTTVTRNGDDLARALKVTGASAAETASTTLARQLGVGAIDWDRHMLVTLSAGLTLGKKLTVTGVSVRGKELVLRYRIEAGPPGLGPTGETVLVGCFDGPVVAEEDRPARP